MESTTVETAPHSRSPLASFITRGVRRTVLPNGLTVLTKELHDRPIVASIIWYRVGSRNEELGQTGKSHFLEHMLFKGTQKYAKGEIDLITLKNGGSNNAFTWLDFTAYYFTFASDRWQVALEIEADRMRNTTFALEEFESEKQVVQEELRIGLDGPWEALENEVWATAFRQHPYRWPTVGWLDDLEAATAEEMKAYYDRWYHPRNATLVLVGDFNTEEVLARVEELFGPIPAGPEPPRLRIVEPPQRGEKRLVVKKETPVERLLIGYHAPAVGHPDSFALHVIETLLSSGKTSRLYRRLVEQDQSVASVSASFHDHIDPSLFYIQAELKPGFRLEDVERAIGEEIERLKNEALDAAELAKAKRLIEADLVRGTEEVLQQAILLGQYETIAGEAPLAEDERGYRFLDVLLDRTRAVTAEDVARVARQYFSRDNRTVGYLTNEDGAAPAGGGEPTVEAARSRNRAERLLDRVAFRQKPTRSSGSTSAAVAVRLDFERFELPNGFVVLLSENHASPSVSISAVAQAGSRYESDDKAGLASLVGELISEGTASRTSSEIAEAIETAGGRFHSAADYETGEAYVWLMAEDLPLGLEIVADVMQNAVFPEGKVRQQIDRRLAQLKSRLDVPRVQASDAFNEIVFAGTPQHRPPVGYEATVGRLTRDDMADFYRRFYVPNNTVLAVVGDFDKGQVRELVEQYFGGWERDSQFRLPEPPRPVKQSAAIEKFIHAPKEQVNIFLGHLGIDRANPDYYALRVMDTILGSSPGFTSRIPRILRDEQGLAYTTFANMTASAGLDPGRFVAYIGTSPENLQQALSGLRREIERMREEPVSEEEVRGARDYLTGSFVFEFQTNAQIADFLIEAELYRLGFDYLEKYPQWIRAIGVDDVQRVARTYLDPERLTTVVVGPVEASSRSSDR